jgi:hypothetical protein
VNLRQKEEGKMMKTEMVKTKKEFSAKCKEVMASTELTLEGKAAAIRRAATFLIENTWDRFPEVRDLEKRWAAAEKKHAGYNGFSYCPESGNWYPDLPPAIKVLDREWNGLRHQKIDEVCRKVRREKAA